MLGEVNTSVLLHGKGGVEICCKNKHPKSTAYPLDSLPSHWFHHIGIVPQRKIESSDILLYSTMDRCVITIRINTALVDYLATIRISFGLIKTVTVSVLRNKDHEAGIYTS